MAPYHAAGPDAVRPLSIYYAEWIEALADPPALRAAAAPREPLPAGAPAALPHLPALHAALDDWFESNARDLPWRAADCTPWGVLVSEVMLQQTPVVRVLPVWEEWLRRWPEPADLAGEAAGEAVRSWGRLGYPRRALRLHAAAVAIVDSHGGEVPGTYAELLGFPGVGSYTAAAVAAFAFGRRETVVDTNIRRVHARLVSGAALPSQALTAAEMRLAASLLPETPAPRCAGTPPSWNSARWSARRGRPSAAQCPVRESCAWLAAGEPPPTYTPKGQAWHGTDRQVRGAVMAVLRAGRGARGAGTVPPGPRGPWLRAAGHRHSARGPAPAQLRLPSSWNARWPGC